MRAGVAFQLDLHYVLNLTSNSLVTSFNLKYPESWISVLDVGKTISRYEGIATIPHWTSFNQRPLQ